MMRALAILFFLSASISATAQSGSFSFDSLFARRADLFDTIVKHKEDYRLQLIYTRIDRDEHNAPHLTTYSFDADKYYFYCASMVKLPACALALERLNDLNMYKVNMFDSLGIDTISCSEMKPANMMLGTPYSCIAQYVKEMMMVSNNRAFNPVYDFLGQNYFQERLHHLGLRSAVISNRFAYCDSDQNRICNPVSLYDRKTSAPKYRQPCIINDRRQFYDGPFTPQVGNGYLSDRGNMLISQPKDFRNANYISLSDLHGFLTKLIFPTSQRPEERLHLTPTDYQYLYKCMGLFPRESAYPVYDSLHYPDHYMKYFMGLDSTVRTMPANLRIFNKVGQAYGFMTDCSYVSDTLNKVEFFLSCSMYLNADGILNDGVYEYDQLGFPFFHNIFNAIYAEEKERPKLHLPVLQWPDFLDTLIVKPAKPTWLRVDSMASMDRIDSVLSSLADSMWLAPRSKDNLSAENIFKKNLEIVLRRPEARHYSFSRLQEKGISFIGEEDADLYKGIRIISWGVKFLADPYPASDGYLLFYDRSRSGFKRLSDFSENANLPLLSYTKVMKCQTGEGDLYLLVAEKYENDKDFWASRSPEYVQAYSINGGVIEKAKVFSINDQLLSDLLIDRAVVKGRFSYDIKRNQVKFPYTTNVGGKIKVKTLKLKFDGTIFK